MTIDECITDCEQVMFGAQMMKQTEVYDYNRQLAEWLRELKKYRAIFEKVGKILADNGYTIDDLDTIFGKVESEEIMQFNTPTHEGYTERCNHTQSEGAYDE